MFKKQQNSFYYQGSIQSDFKFFYSRKGAAAIENKNGDVAGKRCVACKEIKKVIEFSLDPKGFKGYQSSCKKCKTEWKKEWKKANPDKVRRQKRRKKVKCKANRILLNLIKLEMEKHMQSRDHMPIEIKLELVYKNTTTTMTLNTDHMLSEYLDVAE